MRAQYRHDRIAGKLVLYDLDGPVSLTNDMEAVVLDLRRRDLLGEHERWFVYRDTDCNFDGVLLEAGEFSQFVLLHADLEGRAIGKMVNYMREQA